MAQYNMADGRQTVHALTTVSPFNPGGNRDVVFRECLVPFSGCSLDDLRIIIGCHRVNREVDPRDDPLRWVRLLCGEGAAVAVAELRPAVLTIEYTNPNDVDAELGGLYFIRITAPDREYRYIGKTKLKLRTRMNQYRTNLRRIAAGKLRANNSQGYRTPHFVLWQALQNDWPYEFYPLENVAPESVNAVERQRIREYDCNLNDSLTWRIEDLDTLSIEDLLR